MRIEFEQIPWQQIAPGLKSRTFEKSGHRIRLVEFSQEFVEPDWCTRGHFGYVIEGEMVINLNGELRTFTKGDGIFLPPGELHRHKHEVTIHPTLLFLVESANGE